GEANKPFLLALAGSSEAVASFFKPGELSQSQQKSGLWLNGYEQWGYQDETSGFSGYNYNLYGGTLGFDRMLSDHLMAGISLAHSRTSVRLDEHMGETDINGVIASLYGTYFTTHAYAEGALSYGRNAYNNYRYLSIGSMQRTARSDHNGDVYSAYLGGGYVFDVNKWAIGPFGSLKYVYLNEEGFTEIGADSLNLTVSRSKTDSLVSELGLRVARAFKTESGNLIPEVTAALNYDFDIDDRVITASFSGSPDATLTMKGQGVEKYGVTVGAGLTFIHNNGFSTALKYTGEFRNKYQSHGIVGQLRFQF
ncbi:MAG TPA: autotransporter outer membrane beta-barrel domain-containing protein, partial [Syntrophorhabdaceae bacterium]|nr:autotransporter outer membrane beta-barrel domain-containing protein [Syntrophorhabdaceae bacterium]